MLIVTSATKESQGRNAETLKEGSTPHTVHRGAGLASSSVKSGEASIFLAKLP